MGHIKWSKAKEKILQKERGVTFGILLKSTLREVLMNPSRNNQKIMLFEYKTQIWVVPFVEDESGMFLKTAYPSRKYTQKYLGEK